MQHNFSIHPISHHDQTFSFSLNEKQSNQIRKLHYVIIDIEVEIISIMINRNKNNNLAVKNKPLSMAPLTSFPLIHFASLPSHTTHKRTMNKHHTHTHKQTNFFFPSSHRKVASHRGSV